MKLRGTHHAVSSSYRRNHVFMKTRNPFNVMISVELGSHFNPLYSGCSFNVQGRLPNVLCTFNLRLGQCGRF